MIRCCSTVVLSAVLAAGCSKKSSAPPVIPGPFNLVSQTVNGFSTTPPYFNISNSPVIKFAFSSPVDPSSVGSSFYFKDNSGVSIPYTASYENKDSTVVIQPASVLTAISKYGVGFSTNLESQGKVFLQKQIDIQFLTAIDSTDKFPRLTDSALLSLVQQQTFKYFWDFGHPVSGMARERTTSGDLVTTGGSGFGIMAMLVGVQRNFILRTDALTRITTIVNFLATKVTSYHGAFPHWLNGATGATIPFSANDDGGDIVETSYMMQGLLCARQYFNNGSDSSEIRLRTAINNLWNKVDWNWYRQGGQNILYWNWSPDFNWVINVPVRGWNEALITYVLAASSAVSAIPKTVYDSGWAQNGGIKNGNNYFGITLPLGPAEGGPLFFAHYSFLGINPNGLTDAYANYWNQNTAHTQINYNYCISNPHNYFGYSDSCWGLSASDEQNGYSAHAPGNDDGVITPTAAISSLPYTPTQSLGALRFFYYTLGNKIWGQYGFVDAFNLSNIWYDSDWLAIDQGPEIVMIENYRTGLLWNLFMSCPEIKTGMKNLGFQGPNL
jgi:hypothetical protein